MPQMTELEAKVPKQTGPMGNRAAALDGFSHEALRQTHRGCDLLFGLPGARRSLTRHPRDDVPFDGQRIVG